MPDSKRGAGLSRPRSRCQRRRLGQAVPDQAGGDWRKCCRPPKSRRPTTCWWSAAPPAMPRRWLPRWRAGDGDRRRFGAGREGQGHAVAARACQGDGPHGRSGAEGDPANAPYDVIVLNGATEIAPERLYGQLEEGGRLVGVFAMPQPPRAMIVTRSHGDFGHRALFDAAAPVLPGLERRPRVRLSRRHSAWPAVKSRSKSEVWPGCPT